MTFLYKLIYISTPLTHRTLLPRPIRNICKSADLLQSISSISSSGITSEDVKNTMKIIHTQEVSAILTHDYYNFFKFISYNFKGTPTSKCYITLQFYVKKVC